MGSHCNNANVEVRMFSRGGSYDVTVLAFLPVNISGSDASIMEDVMNCYIQLTATHLLLSTATPILNDFSEMLTYMWQNVALPNEVEDCSSSTKRTT